MVITAAVRLRRQSSSVAAIVVAVVASFAVASPAGEPAMPIIRGFDSPMPRWTAEYVECASAICKPANTQ